MPSAPLAEHEEMDRWKRLPVWAQQELQKWRVDEAFQRGRAEAAERSAKSAVRTERRLVAKYIRDVGENECGMSQLDCDLLAERIEGRLHVVKRPASKAGAAG